MQDSDKDIYGSYEDGIRQPYFSIIAKGTNADRKEEFVSVIRQVLEDIISKGIDPKSIEAGINCMEFRYREADFASYPKRTYLRTGYTWITGFTMMTILLHRWN